MGNIVRVANNCFTKANCIFSVYTLMVFVLQYQLRLRLPLCSSLYFMVPSTSSSVPVSASSMGVLQFLFCFF
uniref:Uncharacterized protein n=1 Tax=Anguilla anguilla TaxID=7936 RepID=A0A0E9X1N6_ANGAN